MPSTDLIFGWKDLHGRYHTKQNTYEPKKISPQKKAELVFCELKIAENNGNGTWSFRSVHGTYLSPLEDGGVTLMPHNRAREYITMEYWWSSTCLIHHVNEDLCYRLWCSRLEMKTRLRSTICYALSPVQEKMCTWVLKRRRISPSLESVHPLELILSSVLLCLHVSESIVLLE